jgi:hypothetical protein
MSPGAQVSDVPLDAVDEGPDEGLPGVPAPVDPTSDADVAKVDVPARAIA